MEDLLNKLRKAVEEGKVYKKSAYPLNLKGEEGSYELTIKAVEFGISPQKILEKSLIPAMDRVGRQFSERIIFVPQMLMSAKAMGASMTVLKPLFISGAVINKGTFIIGTVKGDLHDIGKNLVSIMLEGAGWAIVDLGVDVRSDRFVEALNENPDAVVGLSALLTTTLDSMRNTVEVIKAKYATTRIMVGGAPVTQDFCDMIGADFYSPGPQGAVNYLNQIVLCQSNHEYNDKKNRNK